jgi:plastocyanin
VNIRRTTILRSTAATIVAATLTLAACGDDDETASTPTETPAAATAPAAGEHVITIADFAFGGVQTVPAGAAITVVNNDSAPHTFTADDGSFDSGAIQPGDAFQITLDETGTFAYHCEFHGSMSGSITVTA